jgi:hypothetical protein
VAPGSNGYAASLAGDEDLSTVEIGWASAYLGANPAKTILRPALGSPHGPRHAVRGRP